MESAKKRKFLIGLGVYAVILLLIVAVTNVASFNQWFSALLRLFRPVLIGLVLAYLLNTFFRFFERKLLYKVKPHGLRRGLSLALTYLTLFLIITVLLLLIIPQLVATITDFTKNADTFAETTLHDLNLFINWANGILPTKSDGSGLIPPANPVHIQRTVEEFFKSLMLDGKLFEQLVNAETIGAIVSIAENFFSLLADILIGLFISIYLLNTKEKRYAQIMRLRRALFDDKVNEVITRICKTADRSFGGYLKGMLLDSAMVGLLVYIAISIIGVPYAILIAAIIGITNIIPIIGPFIGVIPTAVIVLLTDPSKVIPFVLCILVVQQIDGNIVAPRILGDNTGVSPLCVVIAICTMGNLWGLAGMILGVPLFATVLELTSELLDKRLKNKGLPTDTDLYYTPDLTEQHDGGTVIARIREKKARKRPVSVGGEGNLSATERFRLDTYELAKKHKLFSLDSEERTEQFAEEEAELAAVAEEDILAEEQLAEELWNAETAQADGASEETVSEIVSEKATECMSESLSENVPASEPSLTESCDPAENAESPHEDTPPADTEQTDSV